MIPVFSFDYYVISMQREVTENTPGIDITHSFSHCAMLRKMDSGWSNHHRLFGWRSILSYWPLRAVYHNFCNLQRLSRKMSLTTDANGTKVILQRFISISSLSCPYDRLSWSAFMLSSLVDLFRMNHYLLYCMLLPVSAEGKHVRAMLSEELSETHSLIWHTNSYVS